MSVNQALHLSGRPDASSASPVDNRPSCRARRRRARGPPRISRLSFFHRDDLVEIAFLATREGVLRMVRKINSVSRSSLATMRSLTSYGSGFSPGAHEARAHVDALGAERERCDEAAAVAKATGGDQRDLDLVGGHRNQDQADEYRPRRDGRRIPKPSIEMASTPIRSADSACGARWCICARP